MKLAIIYPILNQFPLAQTAIDFAIDNLSGENDVEVIAIDNASDSTFSYEGFESTTIQTLGKKNVNIKVVRLNKNVGVYPIFWEGLKHTDADILAFFHSDLIVEEKGWDNRLLAEFEKNPKLGMVGFVGSNEIDIHGGRGAGTTSNFLGLKTIDRNKIGIEQGWTGSPASAHGMTDAGYTKAAVVDGCAMIFRRSVLEKIKQRENFPPHHFYDRLLSCEVRELGYEMGVLGIGCDHISGQTVNQESAYHEMAASWCMSHAVEFVTDGDHINYDASVYQEAERQWLKEYRDTKRLVPCKV